MRASILLLGLSAALASCQYADPRTPGTQTLTRCARVIPQADLDSLMKSADPSGALDQKAQAAYSKYYAAISDSDNFKAGAETVMSAFIATQTLYDFSSAMAVETDTPEFPKAELKAQFAYAVSAEAVLNTFVQTQTFVTGTAKAAATAAAAEYLSIVREQASVIVKAIDAYGASSTLVASTTTAAPAKTAAASGTPAHSAAPHPASGTDVQTKSGAAGRSVAGALAGLVGLAAVVVML